MKVQLNPIIDLITPTLTARGTNLLSLKYVQMLSDNTYKFNLRRYTMDAPPTRSLVDVLSTVRACVAALAGRA